MAIEDFQSFCHYIYIYIYIYIYSSPHIFGFWKDHKLKNMGCSKLPSIHFPLTLGTWVWHGNLSCVSWGDELAIQMVPIFSGKLTLTHLIGFQNLFSFFFQFIHVTGMQSNLYVILLSFKHLVFLWGGNSSFLFKKNTPNFDALQGRGVGYVRALACCHCHCFTSFVFHLLGHLLALILAL